MERHDSWVLPYFEKEIGKLVGCAAWIKSQYGIDATEIEIEEIVQFLVGTSELMAVRAFDSQDTKLGLRARDLNDLLESTIHLPARQSLSGKISSRVMEKVN